jgi:hypothetical protein
MGKKSLFVIGIFLILFSLQSCSSKPEKALLDRYFHAILLNDITTMSTMALEPVAIEAKSYEITKVGVDKVEPASLPDLNKKELELKKKLEGHVAPTLDAKDALDAAKDELDSARTGAAKNAAKKKVEELQAKYDQEYELHKQLQKDYNDAKAAAAREEEIATFSLGAGELPTIRELTGNVHSKEVEVKVISKEGQVKNYIFHLRMYNLRDETLNMNRRGRWVIIDFELLS